MIGAVKKFKSLNQIFKTFVVSFKPLANISSFLVVIMFMYAILGVMLFGQVKRQNALNDSLNFESFYNALLVLFVVATGDNWTGIAQSCLTPRSIFNQCIDSPSYQDYVDAGNNTVGCGPKFSGILYFNSYFLVLNLILLKLFIAVIMDGYSYIKDRESQLFNEERITQFN